MKPQPTIVLGCAIAFLLCFPWISASLTGAPASSSSSLSAGSGGKLPIGRECVVTVDPQSTSKPELAGPARIVTGFAAPDTVEGTLVRLDIDWLVIRDGFNENWISRSKVLMIHFSD